LTVEDHDHDHEEDSHGDEEGHDDHAGHDHDEDGNGDEEGHDDHAGHDHDHHGDHDHSESSTAGNTNSFSLVRDEIQDDVSNDAFHMKGLNAIISILVVFLFGI